MPAVVALRRLALTRPLLCPPLLLEGVDEEANALTVVALQRLALTKSPLWLLPPFLAMHVRQQPSVLLRRLLLMPSVLDFRSTLVGLCRD